METFFGVFHVLRYTCIVCGSLERERERERRRKEKNKKVFMGFYQKSLINSVTLSLLQTTDFIFVVVLETERERERERDRSREI